MRAIVSLFKFFVGLSFLMNTVALAFLLGLSLYALIDGRLPPQFAFVGAWGIYAAIGSFIFLVLMTGMSALAISMHDRVCEMTALMEERNSLLRYTANQQYAQSGGTWPQQG